MPRELILTEDGDKQEALMLAVSCLNSGKTIAVPDECGWSLYRSAVHPFSSETSSESAWCGTHDAKYRQSVALAHPDIVLDYLNRPPRLLSKLTSRCWPGPVNFRCDSSNLSSLITHWPLQSQAWGENKQGRAYSCPGDEFSRLLLKSIHSPALSLVGTHCDEIPESFLSETQLVIRNETQKFSAPPTVVSVQERTFQIERPGVVSERMLERLSGEVYLFVCTGNTCRSPMAEAMFRNMLSEHLQCREDELMDMGFVVLSAGLAANRGDIASPEAVHLLRENGIDLSSHESQPVTPDLIKHCDHVFTMTRKHREVLLMSFPENAGQIRLLSQQSTDIPDPIGAGFDEYVRCRDTIKQNLEHILNKIDLTQGKGSEE